MSGYRSSVRSVVKSVHGISSIGDAVQPGPVLGAFRVADITGRYSSIGRRRQGMPMP